MFVVGDVGEGRDATGWVHTAELEDRLDVVTDVTVAFPETSWHEARTDHIQIRGTELLARRSCLREWPTP